VLIDGCNNKSNKTLQELSYGFIGVFVKNSEPGFFDNNEIIALLITQLTEGVDSLPRIKKASTEVFKDIYAKVGQEKFLLILQSTFLIVEQEESK
jgi:hypothetical protein